jgi:hypothetical protein
MSQRAIVMALIGMAVLCVVLLFAFNYGAH